MRTEAPPRLTRRDLLTSLAVLPLAACSEKESVKPVNPELVTAFADNFGNHLIAYAINAGDSPLTTFSDGSEKYTLSFAGEDAYFFSATRMSNKQIKELEFKHAERKPGNDKPFESALHFVKTSDGKHWNLIASDTAVGVIYTTTDEKDPKLKSEPGISTTLTEEDFIDFSEAIKNRFNTVSNNTTRST